MLGIIFFLILLIFITIYWITEEINFKKKYPSFFKLPSPLYLPILGNVYLFIRKDVLSGISKIKELTGYPCVAYIPRRTYLTASPEEFKIILNHPNCLDKSYVYKFLRVIMGKSLLLAPVHDWKRNRKIISKGFKQNILDSFVEIFYEKSSRLNVILKEKTYNVNNIYSLLEKYTLETFCEATLGIESTVMEDDEHVFVKGITIGQKILMSRWNGILKMSDLLFSLTNEKKIMDKLISDGMDYINGILKQKRITRENNIDVCGGDPNRLPVLDILLEQEEKLDNQYITEELILFAGAATDTTAYSMAYTFCLLAMHPEIQQKVREEVLNVLEQDKAVDTQDLVQLKYTEMAISEAMRLLPVVPFIGRFTSSDIDLGTRVIPNGTDIFLDFITCYRNETIYPNPLEYNPDRFLPEEINKRPQYSFLPFSGGPRNCIGLKYAMMVMKTTVANVVRNFEITTKYKSVNELKFESSVVMSTTHPLDLHFTPI